MKRRASGLLDAHRVAHGEEQIGLIGQADHVGGMRAVGRHPQLGAGVALRAFFRIAVADGHRRAVFGGQRLGQARRLASTAIIWLEWA